jgi:hypothetical protein
MNFGYLLIVNTDAEYDYLKMAYALALSIKNTQALGYDNVALIINDKNKIDTIKSPWVFDIVIEEEKLQSGWLGRSYMDSLSPFDHTVCLDVDMLFLRDYSHWIDYFIKNNDLYVTSQCFTYRGDKVTSDYYRKFYKNNQMPELYSMYTFFKKDSELTKSFFDMARSIIDHPKEFKNKFYKSGHNEIIGTDEAFSLSASILDITDDISYDLEFPRIVHMKPMIQEWPWPADSWSDHVGFYLNTRGNLKIGNFQQYDIVHYVEKNTITDELISILEEIAWKKH